MSGRTSIIFPLIFDFIIFEVLIELSQDSNSSSCFKTDRWFSNILHFFYLFLINAEYLIMVSIIMGSFQDGVIG